MAIGSEKARMQISLLFLRLAMTAQVLAKVKYLLGACLVGVTPTRFPTMEFRHFGPAAEGDALHTPMCYDKKNPRHVTRELTKYVQCALRTFKDARSHPASPSSELFVAVAFRRTPSHV